MENSIVSASIDFVEFMETEQDIVDYFEKIPAEIFREIFG